MKKYILFVLALVALNVAVIGQKTFEGKITYGIKLEGENADQMAGFMPTSYEYLISGSNLRFRTVGGMTAAMMGEIVVHGEEGDAYMIKDAEKTAYKMPNDDEGYDGKAPQIEKTGKKAEIAGYSCVQYKVTSDGGEAGDVTQMMWITQDINIAKPKKNGKHGGAVFMDGIDGFPLKIESDVMGMTMIMTATSVKKINVDESEFEIPGDYEVKDFDPSIFGGMGR